MVDAVTTTFKSGVAVTATFWLFAEYFLQRDRLILALSKFKQRNCSLTLSLPQRRQHINKL